MALAAKSHLEMSVACTNCGIQGSKTLKLTGGLDAAKRWPTSNDLTIPSAGLPPSNTDYN